MDDFRFFVDVKSIIRWELWMFMFYEVTSMCVFEMQMFQKTEKYDKDFISEFRLPNQWCPFLFNDYNSTQRRICKANSRSHFNLSKILSFLLLYCWENDRIPLFSLSQNSCVYNFFLSRLGRVGPEPEPTLTRTRRMYI